MTYTNQITGEYNMKHLFTIAVLVLIIIVAYAFYTAVDTFAASDNTVSICDTVDANQTAAYNGHSVDSLDANTRHCVAEHAVTVTAKKHNDTVSNVTVNNVPAIVTSSTTTQNTNPVVTTSTSNDTSPVVVTDTTSDDNTTTTSDDKKAHCNNGNGNGTEGCNASDKGNQDETTVKGDKANEHPSK